MCVFDLVFLKTGLCSQETAGSIMTLHSASCLKGVTVFTCHEHASLVRGAHMMVVKLKTTEQPIRPLHQDTLTHGQNLISVLRGTPRWEVLCGGCFY